MPLFIAIQKLRRISDEYTSLETIKLTVMFVLQFSLYVLLSLTWCILQFAYVRTGSVNLSKAANLSHLFDVLSAVSLGCFIAFIVVKKNKQTPEETNQL